MSDKIRVMLVDDHDMVRVGLSVLLSTSAQLEVVGEAASGEEAVQAYQTLRPDVVLMDLVMPGTGGVGAVRAIREIDSRARILVLTSYHDDHLVREALQGGALGYLLKNVTVDDLVKAIQGAREGKAALAQEAASVLLKVMHHPVSEVVLTTREKSILTLMAQGQNNTEISKALYLSISTVKKGVSSILDKLGANNRAEAVALAMQHGLVTLERH
ncbi:MAG: response regulator transcription factor [bacterium]|nr:response regulator transcription factor [bacterium]